jgi:hypothetical protein
VASALVVYAMPWEELLAVHGSRRRKLVTEITREFGDRLDGLDRLFRDIEPPPSSREAVRRIVYGEELDPGLGTLYAYAFETICWHLGSSFQPGFLRAPVMELDKLLKRRKCPVEVSDLAYRGSPIRIPSEDVAVGYWGPQEVGDAGPFFEGLKLPRAEGLIQELITEINVWLREASEYTGGGLVGFTY